MPIARGRLCHCAIHVFLCILYKKERDKTLFHPEFSVLTERPSFSFGTWHAKHKMSDQTDIYEVEEILRKKIENRTVSKYYLNI